MKFASCSQCGGLRPLNKTVIIEHKRICSDCKKAIKGRKHFENVDDVRRGTARVH
jgi:hypothetical protein